MNHLEVFKAETFVSKSEQSWLNFAHSSERLLGHSLDGDLRDDGYALDDAYEFWENGSTPTAYVAQVKLNKQQIIRKQS